MHSVVLFLLEIMFGFLIRKVDPIFARPSVIGKCEEPQLKPRNAKADPLHLNQRSSYVIRKIVYQIEENPRSQTRSLTC